MVTKNLPPSVIINILNFLQLLLSDLMYDQNNQPRILRNSHITIMHARMWDSKSSRCFCRTRKIFLSTPGAQVHKAQWLLPTCCFLIRQRIFHNWTLMHSINTTASSVISWLVACGVDRQISRSFNHDHLILITLPAAAAAKFKFACRWHGSFFRLHLEMFSSQFSVCLVH